MIYLATQIQMVMEIPMKEGTLQDMSSCLVKVLSLGVQGSNQEFHSQLVKLSMLQLAMVLAGTLAGEIATGIESKIRGSHADKGGQQVSN